ncbi:hypothetical protein I5W21_06810 [Stenotrophomonas maltophilia]|nr:hypothetical protein [Stenotrophomonas maltophilia]
MRVQIAERLDVVGQQVPDDMDYLSLLMARAVLAGAAYQTALEWFRAEKALAELRCGIQRATSAMQEPAEDLQ